MAGGADREVELLLQELHQVGGVARGRRARASSPSGRGARRRAAPAPTRCPTSRIALQRLAELARGVDPTHEKCAIASMPTSSRSRTTRSAVRARVEPPAPNVTDTKAGSSVRSVRIVSSSCSTPASSRGGKNSNEKHGREAAISSLTFTPCRLVHALGGASRSGRGILGRCSRRPRDRQPREHRDAHCRPPRRRDRGARRPHRGRRSARGGAAHGPSPQPARPSSTAVA